MIKRLDIYIIRNFLTTYVFIMGMLIAISIVIDLTEKVSDFMEKHITVYQVAMGYYLYFIPYIGSLLGPFFIFISVIFFTSQLAGRSEFVAMLAAGISYNRILVPYIISATILASLLFFFNNDLLPKANKARIKFENTYINRVRFNPNKNTHRQMGADQYMYVESYSPGDTAGYKVTLEKFKDGRLVYKLRADKMLWQRDTRKWRIENYSERLLTDNTQKITMGASKDTTFLIEPFQLFTSFQRYDEMTTAELNGHITQMKASGIDGSVSYEIEKYKRTASALSIYIFTIIGVCIASRKMRGGMGFQLMLGIGMCALYEVVMKTTTTFSINANLPALVGVWIPNLLYGIVAVYFYRTAQK